MDDADRAEKAAQWMHNEDLFHSRRPEGPRPKIASLCLWCEEVIEVIEPTEEGIRKARRWCCAECRDAWEKEHRDGLGR